MKKTLSILLSALLIITSLSPMAFAESQPEVYGNFNITSTQGDATERHPLEKGEIWAGKDISYENNGEFKISLLAGGRNYTKETPLPQEQYDIVLVLDRSGSMDEDSKLSSMQTAAKGAVDTLLSVPGNRVAIVSYSEDSTTDRELSGIADIKKIKKAIDNLDANDGTNIQSALLRTEKLLNSRSLDDQKRKSIVILMSDGEPTYYHTSLSSHSENNKEGLGSAANKESVWYTILQAQQLKNNVSGLDIYTIGFGVNTDYAKATLMPTSANASSLIPSGLKTIYRKSEVETAEYPQYYMYNSWNNSNSYNPKNHIITSNTPVYDSIGTSLPNNSNWSSLVISSPLIVTSTWTENVRPFGNINYRYVIGTKTRTVYEGSPITFAHQYWSEGSSFVSSDLNALIKAFTDIVNDITNVPPNELTEVDNLSDVTITDVVGSDFEIVDAAALNAREDVTVSGNTITWTIPGAELYTILANETTLSESALNKLTFFVKAKEAAGTNLPTNTSATATFKVNSENNTHYTTDDQTINLTETGLITLVAAQGSITENHVFTDDSSKNTTTPHEGNVGSTKAFEPVSHDGYSYEITTGLASMTFSRNPQTVTFTYTPIPTFSLTVNHVKSTGGNYVDPQVSYNHKTGDPYETSPAEYNTSDYTVTSSGNVSGEFGTENIVVTYTYTPITPIPTYSLTVNHVKSTGGNYVDPEFSDNHKAGDAYSTSPAEYNTSEYTVTNSGNVSGEFGTENIVVTYTYTPVTPDPTYTLTVNHVKSTGGNYVDPEFSDNHKAGDAYSTSPAEYNTSEYTVTNSGNVSGEFGSENIVVTYTYTPVTPEPTYTLTIYHVYSTGGNLVDPEPIPGFKTGQAYSTSPTDYDHDLYTVSDTGNTSGEFESSHIYVTYTYTLKEIEVPDSYTLSTNVVGQGSISVNPDSESYEPGTQVALVATPATGWSFAGWSGNLNGASLNETLTMDGNKSVTATFTENSTPDPTPDPTPTPTPDPDPTPVGPQGYVSITFVDTNGANLSSSVKFSGEIGTNYSTSAKSIDGYSLVDTPANANGTFEDGTIDVEYVYSSDVTIVEEETPLSAAALPIDYDLINYVPETTEEAIIVDEVTPLADALPQTGQLPTELFYGFGSLITAAGLFLKRKK